MSSFANGILLLSDSRQKENKNKFCKTFLLFCFGSLLKFIVDLRLVLCLFYMFFETRPTKRKIKRFNFIELKTELSLKGWENLLEHELK